MSAKKGGNTTSDIFQVLFSFLLLSLFSIFSFSLQIFSFHKLPDKVSTISSSSFVFSLSTFSSVYNVILSPALHHIRFVFLHFQSNLAMTGQERREEKSCFLAQLYAHRSSEPFIFHNSQHQQQKQLTRTAKTID